MSLDSPYGYRADLGEENNNLILQVGVKALLKNYDGKYLLLHRNPEMYPGVSQLWDLVGGRINPGKSLLENLAREINEETGLKLVQKPKLIAAQDILRKPGYHTVRLTYLGEIYGEPILNKEHDKFAWFSIPELKNMPEDELDIYFREVINSVYSE